MKKLLIAVLAFSSLSLFARTHSFVSVAESDSLSSSVELAQNSCRKSILEKAKLLNEDYINSRIDITNVVATDITYLCIGVTLKLQDK